MKIFVLLLLIGATLAAPDSRTLEKLTPELLFALRSKQTTNIFVTLTKDTSEILEYVIATRFPNREAKLNTMHDLLVEHAAQSQKNLINFLSTQKDVEFVSFWIANQLFVKDATLALALQLAEFPEVALIDEEFEAHLIEPVENRPANLSEDYEWGIVKIQAPQAWEAMGKNNGEGIRIATVDTGVRGTHEALKDNFLGEYGWFDPSTRETEPSDRNGHGTHVTGTIAGSKGIGVAPGAKWMACRGCATSACSQFHLFACAQFFACPTLTDGTSPDCSKAPHLISNSWGGGRGSTWFNPLIDAWVAADIIPVFSIGNTGPSCGTAGSPGDNAKVIGVGSTTITDAISSFSSVGPTVDGRMKPQISAPGSEVISAYHTADDAYRALSGTSMACPHVSGTVALLLTRQNDLSLDTLKELLFGNTDKGLTFSGTICSGVGDNEFPNHVFGSGRVNAYKSVTAQTKMMKR